MHEDPDQRLKQEVVGRQTAAKDILDRTERNLREIKMADIPKVGDKVTMLSGEEATVVHVTPSYKEDCDHDFPTDDESGQVEMSSCCTKCGISFTRYIFTECP